MRRAERADRPHHSEQDVFAVVRRTRRWHAPLCIAAETIMDGKTNPRWKDQLASGFNRRAFMAAAAGSAVVPLTSRAAAPVMGAPLAAPDPSSPVPVSLRVNAESKSLNIDA